MKMCTMHDTDRLPPLPLTYQSHMYGHPDALNVPLLIVRGTKL